jgi:exoribonuclease-2
MVDRGLLPDFSPAAIAEVRAIANAAVDRAPAIRDLRRPPWASIDNDDSRDLDQLSVAEPLAAGLVRVLVAIADVDATVAADPPSTTTRAPIPPASIRQPACSRCSPNACRPTSLR